MNRHLPWDHDGALLMKSLLENLICSGDPCPLEKQVYHKIIFVNAFSLLGLIPLILFGIYYSFSDVGMMGGGFFAMVLVAVVNLWLLRRHRNPEIAANVLLLMTLIVLDAAVVFGAQYRTGPFWAAIYPLLAFFSKGIRVGLYWVIAFLLSLYAIIFCQQLGWLHTPFPVDTLAILVVSLIMVTLLVFIYEHVRALAEQELGEADRHIRFLAHHDPLTGLANRSLFFERFEWMLARVRRRKGRLALLFLDLDGFKKVNDEQGHDAGDRVLVEMSRRLTQTVREIDVVARYGGDEFIVLIDDVQSPDDAVGVAKKLIAQVNVPCQVQGRNWNLGVSIGICMAPEHGVHADDLINQADACMYIAKKAGGNRYASPPCEITST